MEDLDARFHDQNQDALFPAQYGVSEATTLGEGGASQRDALTAKPGPDPEARTTLGQLPAPDAVCPALSATFGEDARTALPDILEQ